MPLGSVKDMHCFRDYEPSEILIVDDNPVSFAYDVDNGIPLKEFCADDPDDQELLFLQEYLKEVCEEEDVRKKNRNVFKMWELIYFKQEQSADLP